MARPNALAECGVSPAEALLSKARTRRCRALFLAESRQLRKLFGLRVRHFEYQSSSSPGQSGDLGG